MTLTPDLTGLLDEVWRAHRGTNLARIDAIERVALSVLEGGIDPVAREGAAMDAHKLTGVLGTLGWAEGSKLALEAESVLRGGAPVDAKRLAEIAVALRAGSDARDARGSDAATGHRPIELGPTRHHGSPAATAPRRCVLLADPDRARRSATALQLGLGGYRVVEVGSMREIPDAARDGIDILVSEAQLEDGSAIAYATYLRRDARTASLPILIATHDHKARSLVSRTLGDESMLELPAPPSDLRGRIEALLATAGSAAPGAAVPTTRGLAAAPDVLLVEDDPVLADLLSSALQYRGHPTDVMSDGKAALERLTRPQARPRLVILDAYLPGLDGVSVLRSLAERGALERMSVIMLTVRSGEDEVLASLRLGAVDHVAKPFSLAVLLEKADRLLAR